MADMAESIEIINLLILLIVVHSSNLSPPQLSMRTNLGMLHMLFHILLLKIASKGLVQYHADVDVVRHVDGKKIPVYCE